jgi:signal transduction histidine kinase
MDGKKHAGILVVEDDPMLARILLRSLEGAGYGATVVGTAEDGLARARTGAYDIILTDINLPGMEGLELLSKVKGLTPACDVIIMTGDPSMEKAVEAIKCGAYDFLIKPFSEETLLFTLNRCLEKRGLSVELAALKAYQEELAAAYSQLKSLDRMKDAFLSVVGHELKTPLTVIVGGLAFMNDPEKSGMPPEIADAIRKGAVKLEEIIEEILAYTSVRGGEKKPVSYAPVVITEIVNKAVQELSARAGQLGITVETKFPAAQAVIPGDGARLLLAVKNLVKNAILFNKPQGHVLVEVEDTPKSVNVRVEDTGPGIPAENLKDIYDPFYQVADYCTREVGGLGLGLAIIKQVTESHKGRIEVSSVQGKGSVFTMRLPKEGCSL